MVERAKNISVFERITGFRSPIRIEEKGLVIDLSGLDFTHKRRVLEPRDEGKIKGQ